MTQNAMPDQNWLRSVFDSVNHTRSGQISSTELHQALSKGTWRPFNEKTVRIMITMFDNDRSNTINFQEFGQLWQYLIQWLNCFRSFDRDNSGSIDFNELKQALTTFGYRLSDQFYSVTAKLYDRESRGHILFDDFVRLCIQLQSSTSGFRKLDEDMDGVVKISYEQFLTLVMSNAF